MVLLFLISSQGFGQINSSSLSFQVESIYANYVAADNPDCVLGPYRYYLHVKICNRTASTITNVVYTAAIAGTGWSLANGQNPTDTIVSLAAGACFTDYYYIGFPCSGTGVPNGTVTFGSRDLDDGSTTTDFMGMSTNPNVQTFLYVLKGLTTQATGLVQNAYCYSGCTAGVGGQFCLAVRYYFDKPIDGDFVYVQPAGNLSFDASLLQLTTISAIGMAGSTGSAQCVFPGLNNTSLTPINLTSVASGCPGGNQAGAFNTTVVFCFDILHEGTTEIFPYGWGSSGTQYKMEFTGINYSTTTFLPLELVNFKVSKGNRKNSLVWVTTSEFNVGSYEVLKSVDGINFTKIGELSAKNNSSALNTYTFDDFKIHSTTCYKIRVKELSGEVSYSKIICVENKTGQKADFSIFPNPNTGLFTIQNGTEDNITVAIHSQQGNLISSYNVSPGNNPVDIQDLPNGIYLIKFVSNKTTTMQRIIMN